MTVLCVVLCLFSLFVSSVKTEKPFTAQLVLTLYVFGDSTVDEGNLPISSGIYSIDLNSSSIPRRWTNGKTITDFIDNLFVILEINIGLFMLRNPISLENKPVVLR